MHGLIPSSAYSRFEFGGERKLLEIRSRKLLASSARRKESMHDCAGNSEIDS